MMGTRSKRSNLPTETAKLALLQDGAPPDLDLIIKPLTKLARQVHINFIFDKTSGGCVVWKHLMLMFGSTSQNALNMKSDWQAFASYLGMGREEIKTIENFKFGLEDPVTNTLLAFGQREDATLDRLIEALKKMNRLDILNRISKPLSELCKNITRENSDNMVTGDSGYSEESSVVIQPSFKINIPCALRSVEDLNFRLIYSAFKSGVQENSATIRKCSEIGEVMEHNFLIEAPDEGYENDAAPSKLENLDAGEKSANFDVTVLLTFVGDGRATAFELAKVLRSTVNERGEPVGVVILEEQQHFVNAGGNEFIEGVFDQVDYIIPVLTPNYAAAIRVNSSADTTDCFDAQYARYISKLMDGYYEMEHQMNYKIRSVVPLETNISAIRSLAMKPIFKARKSMKDCEKFAKLICSRKS
ncbi:uncharacterized protein LOC132198565 [Neocloeon triangulifer]|uniref:uncharacterized protein LOC132198565 n=1 Tax=Neocloeon triangulifer TaxID=2078957 RepID=UPI00286FA405|nr:uncharacterized protein LOC132198565 [Neocloeon triangulifer]